MKKPKAKKPVFVDLCCGAGGLSWGFRSVGWKPLFGVDNCEHSSATFSSNLKSRVLQVDVATMNGRASITEAVGKIRPDAVVGGPPCQGFSMAGPRSVADPRNGVIVSCAQVAIALRPKVIVIENVPNLATPKFKRRLDKVLRILRGAGYVADHCTVNAREFGVPQDRRRIIVVAARSASRARLREALETLKERRGRDITVGEALKGLPFGTTTLARSKVPNHRAMDHSAKVRRKIASIEPGSGPLSYRKLRSNTVAPTLVCGHRALPCHYRAPRTITPREAARIQSFPDTFVFRGPRSSQMQQVANAVPPALAAGVGKIVKTLL